MASTGRKKIIFCMTVVLLTNCTEQGRYDKLKMSNICLTMTMLPSAKERLVLPTRSTILVLGKFAAQIVRYSDGISS